MLVFLVSTLKGVSENAWPILAAHRAGEVIPEKLPTALMIEKYVCSSPLSSTNGAEN